MNQARGTPLEESDPAAKVQKRIGSAPLSAPCPYIVAVYDAFTDPRDSSVCLVLEFMNAGSLEGLIKAKAQYPNGEACGMRYGQ